MLTRQLPRARRILPWQRKTTLALMTTAGNSTPLSHLQLIQALQSQSTLMQRPIHWHHPAKVLTQHSTHQLHQHRLLAQPQAPTAFARHQASCCTPTRRGLPWTPLAHPHVLLGPLLRCRNPLQPPLGLSTAPTTASSCKTLTTSHLFTPQPAAPAGPLLLGSQPISRLYGAVAQTCSICSLQRGVCMPVMKMVKISRVMQAAGSITTMKGIIGSSIQQLPVQLLGKDGSVVILQDPTPQCRVGFPRTDHYPSVTCVYASVGSTHIRCNVLSSGYPNVVVSLLAVILYKYSWMQGASMVLPYEAESYC